MYIYTYVCRSYVCLAVVLYLGGSVYWHMWPFTSPLLPSVYCSPFRFFSFVCCVSFGLPFVRPACLCVCPALYLCIPVQCYLSISDSCFPYVSFLCVFLLTCAMRPARRFGCVGTISSLATPRKWLTCRFMYQLQCDIHSRFDAAVSCHCGMCLRFDDNVSPHTNKLDTVKVDLLFARVSFFCRHVSVLNGACHWLRRRGHYEHISSITQL